MDEEYWKGQVDAKLDFIKEQMTEAKNTLSHNVIKNDLDHEVIKGEITSLKIKSSIWGMLAGSVAAVGTMAAKYLLGK
jgi:hypothetical protein